MINLHLGDSLAAMRAMDDNAYDLAIVDPPYGMDKQSWLGGGLNGGGQYGDRAFFAHHGKGDAWDNAPTPEYFDQLRRVSRNQIIWGGNYFPSIGRTVAVALLRGINANRGPISHKLSSLGHHTTNRPNCLNLIIVPRARSTQHKNRCSCTNGYWIRLQTRGIASLIRIWDRDLSPLHVTMPVTPWMRGK